MTGALLRLYRSLTLCLLIGESGVLAVSNVAQGLPVYGWGRGLKLMTDSHYDTGYEGENATFPIAYINLKAVYGLGYIELTSQYRLDASIGINEPFNVYTWSEHTAPCMIAKHYPWKLCAANVTFDKPRSKKYILCLPDANEVQYLIFTRGSPENMAVLHGVAIYDVKVFGLKLRNDDYILPSFDDTPKQDYYAETKTSIWKNTVQVRSVDSNMQFEPTLRYYDVVCVNDESFYTVIAAKRDQGRVIMISGQRFWNRIFVDKHEPVFMQNMREWLTQGSNSAPIVTVNNEYNDGDILAIVCQDEFDVNSIETAIRSGKHSAFLVITDECRSNMARSFEQLMEKLEVTYRRQYMQSGDFWASPSTAMESRAGYNWTYIFDFVALNWHSFRTVRYFDDFRNLDENTIAQLGDPSCQQVLTRAIDKYRPYFEETASCDLVEYPFDLNMKAGRINFNTMHFAQLTHDIRTLPAVEQYPGVVNPTRKPEKVQVRIIGENNLVFQPLGVFVNPGEAFTWKVINSTVSVNRFRMRVSCQTDFIDNKSAHRWPAVSHSRPITQTGTWASPTGGPLYLDMPKGSEITIEVDGGYRYPWVYMRDPKTFDDWEVNKAKYGGVPRMHIVGDMFHACLPWEEVSMMSKEDLKWVLGHYDNVVKVMHNYRGSDWRTARHQIMVTDYTIKSGEAHSGLPFMARDYWTVDFTVRSNIQPEYSIIVIHEIGHNLQTAATVLKNGREVTNNVFIPVVHGNLLHVDMYEMHNTYGLYEEQVTSLAQSMSKGEFEGFSISYYVYLGYVFGEGLIGNTWRYINSMTNAPTGTHESMQNYIIVSSRKAGYNLVPFNRLWNVPVDASTMDAVRDLPCFIPKDSVTRLNEKAVQRVLIEYGRSCLREGVMKVRPEVNYTEGVDAVRPPVIFLESV